MPSIPALILKALLVINRAPEPTPSRQVIAIAENQIAPLMATLRWPKYTEVVPTSQHQFWSGGYGWDKAEANFAIGKGGFQLETFQLVIWSPVEPWSTLMRSPPIDRANVSLVSLCSFAHLPVHDICYRPGHIPVGVPTPTKPAVRQETVPFRARRGTSQRRLSSSGSEVVSVQIALLDGPEGGWAR